MSLFKKETAAALVALTAALLAGSLIISAAPASAATSYAANTSILVGSRTLKIMAGSVVDSLEVNNGGLTVTVPEGEALDLRAPYPLHFNLENDALLPACNVIAGSQDNRMFILGPRTLTVIPGNVLCPTTYADSNIKPSFALSQPAAGESLNQGQSYEMFWQTSGTQAQLVTIKLSSDSGATFPLTVVQGISNIGFYQWTVPSVVTTDHARLKFYGLDGQGNIVALGVSPADFHIEGTAPPAEEPAEELSEEPAQTPAAPAAPPYDFDKEAVTAAAATIDVNQAFSRSAGSPESPCAGMRVKIASSPAVYFCGADGKRHAFPNQKIHDSWYAGDFGGVVTVSDAYLAGLQLGPNVTYRPGIRLVKIQTDPRVYAVAADGTLRWVPSEQAAIDLYGADWNKMIDDVPDSFFVDYRIGTMITMK